MWNPFRILNNLESKMRKLTIALCFVVSFVVIGEAQAVGSKKKLPAPSEHIETRFDKVS
jgi:hypothetical protein